MNSISSSRTQNSSSVTWFRWILYNTQIRPQLMYQLLLRKLTSISEKTKTRTNDVKSQWFYDIRGRKGVDIRGEQSVVFAKKMERWYLERTMCSKNIKMKRRQKPMNADVCEEENSAIFSLEGQNWRTVCMYICFLNIIFLLLQFKVLQ